MCAGAAPPVLARLGWALLGLDPRRDLHLMPPHDAPQGRWLDKHPKELRRCNNTAHVTSERCCRARSGVISSVGAALCAPMATIM